MEHTVSKAKAQTKDWQIIQSKRMGGVISSIANQQLQAKELHGHLGMVIARTLFLGFWTPELDYNNNACR